MPPSLKTRSNVARKEGRDILQAAWAYICRHRECTRLCIVTFMIITSVATLMLAIPQREMLIRNPFGRRSNANTVLLTQQERPVPLDVQPSDIAAGTFVFEGSISDQLRFSREVNRTFERRIVHGKADNVMQLNFGPWSMKYPRFIRTSHLLWWQTYEVVRWRKQTVCGTTPPRQLLTPGIVEYLELATSADLWLAKDVTQKAFDMVDPIPEHDGWMQFCTTEETTGTVHILENATLRATDYDTIDCGQGMDPAPLMVNTSLRGNNTRKNALFWAPARAAPFFQHWMQNILPKIAQAHLAFPATMQQTSAAGVVAMQEFLPERFPMVPALYKHMGWGTQDLTTEPQSADKTIYSCEAPALHPLLWRLGQEKSLGVIPTPSGPRKKIVYCGRSQRGTTENPGRKVFNEEAVFTLLYQWVKDDPTLQIYEFDHRRFERIEDIVTFFSDAKVIIGPHGGCLTNVVFTPPGALVIELFPLVNGFAPPLRHSGMMMYMQSMFIDHNYWMLPIYSAEETGDFDAPIEELCDILVRGLGPPSARFACTDQLPYMMFVRDHVMPSKPCS